MANVDQPRGLWPIRHLKGGQIRLTQYSLTASSTAAAVALGDPVILGDDGYAYAFELNKESLTIGVVAGIRTGSGTSESWCNYVAGSTAATLYVIDDPDVVFGIQADSGTALAVTSVGSHADLVATAPDSTKKLSQMELDASNVGTGQHLHILGKVARPDNTWAEHVDLEVVFNEHRLHRPNAGY